MDKFCVNHFSIFLYCNCLMLPLGDVSCNNNKRDGGLHQVGTWRPAQSSPIATMRRFFLGGCQLMADSSYLAVDYCSGVCGAIY